MNNVELDSAMGSGNRVCQWTKLDFLRISPGASQELSPLQHELGSAVGARKHDDSAYTSEFIPFAIGEHALQVSLYD
jgi:hypothetical protein